MARDPFRRAYLDEISKDLRALKKQADRAIEQTSDVDLFAALDPEANSIAVIVRHMAGNMRSRWVDFLTTDGEKPDRMRDREFEMPAGATRDVVMRWWEDGWRFTLDAIESLTPEDLDRTVFIRDEPHSIVEAINRQLTHYASHVGQIVLLAKHHCGPSWQTLSVPRGKSEEYLAMMRAKRNMRP